MKLSLKITNTILFLFLMFGVAVSSIYLHELSHKADLNPYVENGGVCMVTDFISSEKAGYYEFTVSEENRIIVDEILLYTEYKAYSVTALVIILYLICWSNYMFNRPEVIKYD